MGNAICERANISCSWARRDIIVFGIISISNEISEMDWDVICGVTFILFRIVHTFGQFFFFVTGFFLSNLWDVEINVESRVHICSLLCNVSVHGFIIAQKQGALYLHISRNGTILFPNLCSVGAVVCSQISEK